MNKQNFNQLGGFPLETDIFDWMQTAYTLFNALGDTVGNYGIIQGCTTAGSTVTDGVVYIDGELYKFIGGTVQATVKILETTTTKVFENGDSNPVHFERYVTFASGTGAINWADFKKPETLLKISQRILPPNTNPQLYSGNIANIPTGWQLCDGTNGTPDLRSRFIVGYNANDADYNTIGNVGGSKQHQLTVAQLPKFKPTGTAAGPYTGNYIASGGGFDGGNNKFKERPFTGNEIGGNQPHENRPPYYTLAYIIYIG